MLAIQKSGETIEIGDFKAVRGGIVLFEDEDRDETIGFIPFDSLQTVLTEELAREQGLVQEPEQQRQVPQQAAGQQHPVPQPPQAAGQQQGQQMGVPQQAAGQQSQVPQQQWAGQESQAPRQQQSPPQQQRSQQQPSSEQSTLSISPQ